MWTKLMVRLWAIANEPAYAYKAIRNILIFFSALYLFCEISMIGEWGLGDMALTSISLTMLILLAADSIKRLIEEIKEMKK